MAMDNYFAQIPAKEKRVFPALLIVAIIFLLPIYLISVSWTTKAATDFYDNFDRVSLNTWGTSSSGEAYTIGVGSTNNLSTDGQKGKIVLGATSTQEMIANNVSIQNNYINYQLNFDELPTGTSYGLMSAAVLRFIDPNNSYRIESSFRTDSSIQITVAKEVGGEIYSIGSPTIVSGLSPDINKTYNIRAEAVGVNPTTLQMKIWDSTLPEPGTYTKSIEDSEVVLQASGSAGLRTSVANDATQVPVTFFIDTLSISDNPAFVIPTASPTATTTTTASPTASPTSTTTSTPTASPTATTSPTGTITPTTDPRLRGDFNLDGTVNLLDLSILAANWGTTNTVADANDDGSVGLLDLSILAANWGITI